MERPRVIKHTNRDGIDCVLFFNRVALPDGLVFTLVILLALAFSACLGFGLSGMPSLLIVPAIIGLVLGAWLVSYVVGLIRRVNRKDLH